MQGQVSFEFMTVVFIILSILMLIFATASRNQIISQENEVQVELMNVCENILDKINKAIYYGEGFYQEIDLPSKIYGNNYSIKVQDNKTLICSTQKFSFVEIFIENKIKNETSSPPFFVAIKKISVSNSKGTVIIK